MLVSIDEKKKRYVPKYKIKSTIFFSHYKVYICEVTKNNVSW